MSRKSWGYGVLAAALVALLTPVSAHADSISFVGAFVFDDDVHLETFTLVDASDVDIITFGYAGGVTGDGTVIPDGGFDPILSLFNSLGNLLSLNDDGAGVPASASSGLPSDARILIQLAAGMQLAAGTYTLAITQDSNFPNGPTLADGFGMAGTGNFTGGPFLDASGSQRTGDWAFDIRFSPTAVVPAPSSALLLLLGGTTLVGLRFRARKHD